MFFAFLCIRLYSSRNIIPRRPGITNQYHILVSVSGNCSGSGSDPCVGSGSSIGSGSGVGYTISSTIGPGSGVGSTIGSGIGSGSWYMVPCCSDVYPVSPVYFLIIDLS